MAAYSLSLENASGNWQDLQAALIDLLLCVSIEILTMLRQVSLARLSPDLPIQFVKMRKVIVAIFVSVGKGVVPDEQA